MRVIALETLRKASQPNLLVLRLRTDDGLVGLGESFFGARAVELVLAGQFGHMVAFHPPDIVAVPLEKVVGRTRNVPLDFDVVRIEVTDDGRGFDPEARVEGFGLVGMHERVALAHGQLEVESAAGRTVVRASLPVGVAASSRVS